MQFGREVDSYNTAVGRARVPVGMVFERRSEIYMKGANLLRHGPWYHIA